MEKTPSWAGHRRPRGKGLHGGPRARLPGPGVGEGTGHTPKGGCKSSTPECVRKEATGLAHAHAHPHPGITPRRVLPRCPGWEGQAMWVTNGATAVALTPLG